NGHLQNIPSAKEVAEYGVKLGEMNAKLLQKIEELMLYTIQQEKKIEILESRLESIESNTANNKNPSK
ncbi:MAG: cell wall anchor protein, partial [Flavobacteriaceae bacterium]